MGKHTPGPWMALKRFQSYIDIKHGNLKHKGAASGTVARVTCRDTWADEQTANARLIAAAPDLLEAATHALRALRSNPDSPMTGSECLLSMAIVKATGETQ